ncbi:hypothetical protein FHR50_003648 [Xanthomonas arboricola]
MIRFASLLPGSSNQVVTLASCVSRSLGRLQVWSRARCPHRSRDTPQVRPCRLGGGIHAATRSRNRRGHHARQLVGGFVEKQSSPHRQLAGRWLRSLHTDHLDWSLPAHRRRTLGGMDAATEPTGMYLRRVLRWWAGKGPAAKAQTIRSALLLPGSSDQVATPASCVSRSLGDPQVRSRARRPHARGTRRKYVPVGSVAASMPPHGPAIGEDTTPDSWLVALLKSKVHRIASLLVAG